MMLFVSFAESTPVTAVSGETTVSAGTGTGSTTSFVTGMTGISTEEHTGSTTKRCEEMQAVDAAVSSKITVSPNDLPKGENLKFQPTSTEGVSFDDNDRKPTITVSFEKPAQVQSVTLPRDKTPNANVQQFEVTFYSPDGKKTTDQPILSELSPTDDKSKPAKVDFSQIPSHTPVSRVEITVVRTTDDEAPKGVVLDIKACVEATTGEFTQFPFSFCL